MTATKLGNIDLNVLEHDLVNQPKWAEIRNRIRQLRTVNAAVIDFQQIHSNLTFLTSFWENADLAAPLLQHSILLYARATTNGNDGLSGWNFEAGLTTKALRDFHSEVHDIRNKWVAHYGSFYPETAEPFLDDRIVAVFDDQNTLALWGPWTRHASASVTARKLMTLAGTLGEFGDVERRKKAEGLVLKIKERPELIEIMKANASQLRFEPISFFRNGPGTWPPGPPHQPFTRISLSEMKPKG
ncbi:hypothetical protein ACKWRH_21925 [Bradyrhizobium sp. Pa8]|uniref:hypothetical protein n=1 Tax=Bradyrhizobium sp. Pa8 TaxID=3386552 RepID=UPI00403FB1D3